MPTSEVSTRGSRQYPSTEAERGKVKLLDDDGCDLSFGSCVDDDDDDPASAGSDEWWSGSSGGDMSDRITCREVLPNMARP